MPIPGTATSTDTNVYYTEAVKVIVRSEKEYLLARATIVALDKPYERHACRNDFYRLLRNRNIPAYLHWVTAFINDVTDPYQNVEDMTYFYQIDESFLIKAITRANTQAG